MATKVRLEHIARLTPPWREAFLTECGLDLKRPHLSRADYLAKAAAQGDWAAATTCRTCMETVARWPALWETDPMEVIGRDIKSQESCGNIETTLTRELWALAELVKQHRIEFTLLMAETVAAGVTPKRLTMQLQEVILGGTWQQGEALPHAAQLAKRFDSSPEHVGHALTRLTEMRWLICRDGRYILNLRPPGPTITYGFGDSK